jgi:hypothetical protein
MTQAELIRAVLIEGAIGGAVLSLVAWLLSRFTRDIVGRTLLATVLFAAAGAYFGFAVVARPPAIWGLLELLQVVAGCCFRCDGPGGLEGFSEVARTWLGVASGLGFRSPPSWTGAKLCSTDLRLCMHHFRLGCGGLYSHCVSRSQPPNAES